MHLKPNESDPSLVDTTWEERDLEVLSAAYSEMIALWLLECPEDEISELDITIANSYADKNEHLSKTEQIPREWIEGMAVALRNFAEHTNEQALTAIKRNGLPYYKNPYHIERLELGRHALEMARQIQDPEGAAALGELEVSLNLPWPGEETESPSPDPNRT